MVANPSGGDRARVTGRSPGTLGAAPAGEHELLGAAAAGAHGVLAAAAVVDDVRGR